MQWINELNRGVSVLLCFINIYGKYALIFPLKDKGMTITNAFQNFFR